MAEVKDAELGRTTTISYDTAERPAQAEQWETTEHGDELRYHLIQRYDRYDQPCKFTERVHRNEGQRGLYETEVAYDKESRPTEMGYSAQLEGKKTEAAESKVSYHPRRNVVKDTLHIDTEGDPHTLHADFAAEAQTQRRRKRPVNTRIRIRTIRWDVFKNNNCFPMDKALPCSRRNMIF